MKTNPFLKTGNGILLIAWFLLSLLDQPSGLEGYGAGLFSFVIMLITIPLALMCSVVAFFKGEGPFWAYATLLLLAIIPVLSFL